MNYVTKILDNIEISEDYFILRVKRPVDFIFRPGQFTSLGLNDIGINREYSISSGTEEKWLDFLIKLVPDGTLTPLLKSMLKGQDIEMQGPFGEFFNAPVTGKTALICTGSGAAPFMAIAQSRSINDYRIWHCIRHDDDNVLDFLPKNSPYKMQVSSKNGRIQQQIDKTFIKEHINFFLCGNRLMITDVFEKLTTAGISTSNIHTEVFF